MRKRKIGALACTAAGLCLLLTGCGPVDEDILNTQANTAVDISIPYATATPLPEYLNVPDPIVIDSDGNVTLNDASIIEGDFQSARDEEEQTEYRSLTLGSNGIAVQALQSRLQELGYFDGESTSSSTTTRTKFCSAKTPSPTPTGSATGTKSFRNARRSSTISATSPICRTASSETRRRTQFAASRSRTVSWWTAVSANPPST